MFSKDSKSGAPAPAAAATPEPSRQGTHSPTQSIISRDVKIKGDLICNGDIQIDGEVEGDVQSRSITIGEGADIRGTISGDNVRVCGSVNGQIKGNSVVLEKTAKVIGDVMHQTLAIEPGAFFEGRCSRIDGSQSGDRVAAVMDRPVAGSGATSSATATR
jgi:cytoskeletal protein CcmA (bactofilin family)